MEGCQLKKLQWESRSSFKKREELNEGKNENGGEAEIKEKQVAEGMKMPHFFLSKWYYIYF